MTNRAKGTEVIGMENTQTQKPKCKLVGQDGNIFNLVGIAARTLRRAGMNESADQMTDRVFKSHSYDEALAIICEYVEAY